ncbi:hypothetical protein HDV00_005654 [Rhizophlyctis rosea]|nr:hypothetical protein HDV00_005654 [Rhizophlyctis rosea]
MKPATDNESTRVFGCDPPPTSTNPAKATAQYHQRLANRNNSRRQPAQSSNRSDIRRSRLRHRRPAKQKPQSPKNSTRQYRISLQAVDRGDLDLTQTALRVLRSDPDMETIFLRRSLFLAAHGDHAEIVHLLLVAGARDHWSSTCFEHRVLYRNGSRRGQTRAIELRSYVGFALGYASTSKVLTLLLQAHEYPRNFLSDRLFTAIVEEKIEVVETFIKANAPVKPNYFTYAVKYSPCEIVAALIEGGADVYGEDEEPLLTAAGLGRVSVVKVLLAARASASARREGKDLSVRECTDPEVMFSFLAPNVAVLLPDVLERTARKIKLDFATFSGCFRVKKERWFGGLSSRERTRECRDALNGLLEWVKGFGSKIPEDSLARMGWGTDERIMNALESVKLRW